MRSLRVASKRLFQIIPTSLQVMWLPYLQIRLKSTRAKRCSERIPLTVTWTSPLLGADS